MKTLFNKLRKKNSNQSIIYKTSENKLNKIILLASLPVPILESTEIVINPESVNQLLETNKQLLPYTTVFTNNEKMKTICDGLSQYCVTYDYVPEIKAFIISDQDFVRLANNAEQIFKNIAIELQKTPSQTGQIMVDFFQDKQLIIQPKGLQGILYKAGRAFQDYGSIDLVAKYVTKAKLTGVRGSALIKLQPMVVVAVPYLAGLSFMGASAIVGNNIVGRAFYTVGDVCLYPMRFIEWTFNANISPFLNNTLGIPIILNSTKVLEQGIGGITIEDMRRIIPNPKALVPRIAKWAGGALSLVLNTIYKP